MNIIDKLIGKTFSRNVYGMSAWKDVITNIDIRYGVIYPPDKKPIYQRDWFRFITSSEFREYPRKVEIMIKGTNHWYDLNEIVIYP